MKVIPIERKRKMIQMLQEGKPRKDIQAVCKVSAATIGRYAIKYEQRKPVLTQEDCERAINLYEKIGDWQKVAIKMDVSLHHLRNELIRRNLYYTHAQRRRENDLC